MLGKAVKSVLGRLFGLEIECFGPRTYALIDCRRRADGWFSYRNQLRALFESRSIDVVLDVGANAGQFASSLRSFYHGPIHSFEPVTSVFEKLLARSASDPHWTVHRMALGSRNLHQTIHVSARTEFSSFLKTNDYSAQRFADMAREVKAEVVQVRRLEDVLGEILPMTRDKQIFLKLDTQGYDLEVFAGLGKYLHQVQALCSEISLLSIYEGMPHWTEAIKTYEQSGLRVSGMFPVSRDADRIIEYDCLMVRSV